MPASADPSQKVNHDAIAMARFFSGLLNQDIELRIRFAEYFSFVSSESHPWRTYLDDLKNFVPRNGKKLMSWKLIGKRSQGLCPATPENKMSWTVISCGLIMRWGTFQEIGARLRIPGRLMNLGDQAYPWPQSLRINEQLLS
jgi:hypothetical protein